MVLFRNEMRQNRKMLLLWSLVVGVICCLCLFLYSSLEQSMEEMTDAFAGMGAFSQALGMDRISIGTLEGYYAIEIAIILSLGGAMFAAMLGAGIVSKEEEGHTSEFLNTLPIGRSSVILQKYLAVLANLVLFHMICIVCVLIGFAGMKEMPDMHHFVVYHLMVFLMTMEVGTICFLISAISRTKLIGGALGLAVLLYVIDLVGRVLPDMEHVTYVSPFYYCNGSEIFSGEKLCIPAIGIGVVVILVCVAAAYAVYGKRDLSA